MPITIRPAVAADQPAIRRMIREANLNRMGLDWPNFLVAEEGSAIVGVGQLKTHADGSREVASIAVVPARQGAGIGSSIVRALLERHGEVELHLTCRRETQVFYERFGFRRLERRELPPYFARLIPFVNVLMRLYGTQLVVMRREPVPVPAGR